MCCEIEVHTGMKLDDRQWDMCALAGVQTLPADVDEPAMHYEMRNCYVCDSTLLRETEESPRLEWLRAMGRLARHAAYRRRFIALPGNDAGRYVIAP